MGELASGVGFAALEGRGGEVEREGSEEDVAGGVAGVVEGWGVAERGQEEGVVS